ncbi:MliC family protein [Sphingopyxis sp.]|uniref:MliC family protein n=1 Tax=Sphingopyxis sp. TaxID=1908224 RepID=UPI0035B0EAAE
MDASLKIAAASALALTLAACASTPPRTGSSYQCSSGTKLTVNYLPNAAIVRVNGGRTMTLRSTPANTGQVYENRTGARLARNGNDVTWNTAARTAPESCRPVYTPL